MIYIQNKKELKEYLTLMQDTLDDCLKWAADNEDAFSDELGSIQMKITEIRVQLNDF